MVQLHWTGELRYAITTCGLEYVLPIRTKTTTMLSVELLDMLDKVESFFPLLLLSWIIFTGTTYSFNPFFKLSVIPYDHRRLSCSSTENNFTNCQSSVSLCSIYNSVYLNLNCQSKASTFKHLLFFNIITREMQSWRH